jgi:hypothetical protein
MTKMNHHVIVLDQALTLLHKKTVLENPLFEIDADFYNDDFTRIRAGESANPLIMDFSDDGIDVHLNGVSEVFSWGIVDIEEKTAEIIQMLVILLTSNIQVNSYGDNYKKFVFKEVSTDKVLKEIKIFDGLFINPFKKNRLLFSAIIVE